MKTDYWSLSPRQRFFYRWRQLKKDFPLNRKVILITKDKVIHDGHNSYGYCYDSKKRNAFVVVIQRMEDAGIMVDTAWHEYAHLLMWDELSMHRPHPRKFWDIYGTIYRHYQDT